MSERKTLAFLNDEGKVQLIDLKTGEVVDKPREVPEEEALVPIQNEKGELVYVEKGMRIEDLRRGPKSKYQYSPLLGDIICQKIAEGGCLTKICKESGMPSYSTLARWRREFPEFEGQLNFAKLDRAEWFADKALEEAISAKGKDDTPAQRLKHDAYKWRSSVDNPKDYSTQARVVGDNPGAVNIIIETGIRRPGDVGFKDVTEEVNRERVVTEKPSIEGSEEPVVSPTPLLKKGEAADEGNDKTD